VKGGVADGGFRPAVVRYGPLGNRRKAARSTSSSSCRRTRAAFFGVTGHAVLVGKLLDPQDRGWHSASLAVSALGRGHMFFRVQIPRRPTPAHGFGDCQTRRVHTPPSAEQISSTLVLCRRASHFSIRPNVNRGWFGSPAIRPCAGLLAPRWSTLTLPSSQRYPNAISCNPIGNSDNSSRHHLAPG